MQLQYSAVGQWPCITIMSINASIMSNLEILALNNYGNAPPLPELENGAKPTASPISFPTIVNTLIYYLLYPDYIQPHFTGPPSTQSISKPAHPLLPVSS